MSETQGILVRLISKLRGIFDEDWTGKAGAVWHRTIVHLAQLNQEHLRLEEKVEEAPGLAWNAVQGLASEKHAKASSDYSKAENDRIDTQLKRRVLEDKVRQERAAANKAEAEAVISRITELKARIELAKELEALGVVITINKDGSIGAYRSSGSKKEIIEGLLNAEERNLLTEKLFDVVVPFIADDVREVVITRWFKRQGDAVDADEPLLEIDTVLADIEIPCPVAGVLTEILFGDGSKVTARDTIIARVLQH